MSEQFFRDSGQDWIGSIPSHWNIHRLGAHFTERKVTVNDTDYPALSVTMQGIVPQLETAAKSDANDKRKLVLKGDFVINSRSDRKGSSGVSPLDGSVSQISIVLEPKGISPLYANYLLRSYPFQEEFYKWGSGIVADLWSTRFSAMKQILIPVPPRAEQDAIVDFLDRELAQIDNLIHLQLQLSARLSERKHSLVSSAVYGLAGSDSIYATPTLPNGWMWRKLKGVVTFQASNVDKKTYEDGSPVRLCNYVDVYYNDEIHDGLDFMEATASKKEIDAFTLRAGDVIITKDSESEADIGIPSYVPKDLPGVVCGYHLTILRSKGAIKPKFLKLVLETSQAKSHFAKRANGLTRMALGQGAIGDLAIPLPPLEVQDEIATATWRKLGALNEAILSSNSLVQRLRERRSALVSEAVTGKLQIKGGRNG